MDSQFFLGLVEMYKPYLLTLVGLVILDVLMGVSSALKTGAFEWKKMSEFYSKSVLPGLIGWMAFTVAAYLVAPDLLGSAKDAVTGGISIVAWTTVVLTLVASITKSTSEVLGVNLPGPIFPQKQ